MFIDDEREIVQRMVVEYENERRSWFTWIGTQPGLRFAQAKDLNIPTPETGGPVDDEIFVTRNLRVFRTFLLGGLAGFVNVFDINNVPITESNSTTFTDPRNDTRGCGVFDDFSFNYTRPPNVLTEGDFDVSYIMLDGAARAYWYRRDTRGGLDHVSGDFHCN
jgi:hypothetical protein